MKKIAVVLSGCGYLDGAEIRESVFTLLALDEMNVKAEIFAPNREQSYVVDHLTAKEEGGARNILVESARIARGQIRPIDELNASEFSALILPGGFGAAKNFSTIAFAGADALIESDIKNVIQSFYKAKKPIGAICISPAIVALALKSVANGINLTLGNDSDLLVKMGLAKNSCNTDDIIVDSVNLLVSTPAYMHDDRIINVRIGIQKLVNKIVEWS